MEGIIMIKCLVFLFCCIMPYAAEAGEILNVQDGFQLVKAVKLGRGKAYSVATDASLNTGAGGTQIKNCPANCADCEDSTHCIVCKSGYGKHRSGECVACPDNCSECIYNANIGAMTCSGGCASGYHLEYNSTGSYSDCCPTGRILSDSYPYPCVPETCEAGTYRSGSNLCESCPSGTYSSGSNQGSCRPCSDIRVNIGSNQYVNCSACSSTGSCTSYSCPAGYYLKKSGSGCEKCPDGCSACSDSSMGVYCTACSSGYTMGSNSYGLGKCNKSSCSAGYYLSGSNCVACASGTYSKGGTATSCSSCSTLYTSAGSNTCTSCTTTGTCTGSNSGSSSSGGSRSCPSGTTYKTNVRACSSNTTTYSGCVPDDFGRSCTNSSQCSRRLCAPCYTSSGQYIAQGSTCR